MTDTKHINSRRNFTGLLSLGLMIALVGPLAPTNVWAAKVDFSPAKFEKINKSGQPVMLDFYASWCGTCRTQSRAIDKLRSENKAYQKITFMRVDWDTYKSKPIARDLKIPRRSTLVMFKGGREVGRIVAGTSTSSIKKLLDKGI